LGIKLKTAATRVRVYFQMPVYNKIQVYIRVTFILHYKKNIFSHKFVQKEERN